MSNIINLPEELKKELRMNSRGETSCSIRGLARMFAVDHKGLCSHFSGDLKQSFLAKTLMEQGFDMVTWSENGVPDYAIPTVAQYYAFDAKQVTEETRNMARGFIRVTSTIGVRTFFQRKLGVETGDSSNILMSQLSLMVQEAIKPVLEQVTNQNLMLEASAEERTRLQQENNELNAVSREIDRYPHFRKLLEEAMNNIDEDDFKTGITCREYIIKKLIPLHQEKWLTVSRRTAHYYLSTKGCNPQKRGSRNVYSGKDVAFIAATIAIVCQGL